MAAGRGPQGCLIVVFLALIGVVPASQIVLELRAGDTPGIVDLFRQVPTRANLKRLESDLESRCRLAQAVRPAVQYVRFVLLQDAGDQALLGRSGWFFYRPGVQYLIEEEVPGLKWQTTSPPPACPTVQTSYSAPENDFLAAIVSFRGDLAKRGIKLVVMPAPNKSSVYPEKLTGRADGDPNSVNPTSRRVLSMLRQAGVEVVDLFEAYGQVHREQKRMLTPEVRSLIPASYLAQDSHWSPLGMQLAANVVARRLLGLGWVAKGAVRYDSKRVTVERYGDVLHMIRVPRVQQLYEPERIECTQVIDAKTGKPYEDDPNSPVLVLGDSFLRIYERDEPGSAGFIAHLARNLGFGLTSIVNDGGASTLVRQQLARKPALLRGKKVVIWEFVERDIRFGTEGWQVIPLP